MSVSDSPTPAGLPPTTAPKAKRPYAWLRAFTCINAFALAYLWWLENSVGEDTNPTALLLYVPQHPLVLPTMLLVLASLWRRSYFWFACNVWVLCAWAFSFGGFQVPRPQWPSSRPTVRVVTWNINFWEFGPRAVPRQLSELAPDIICLAEADPRRARSGMGSPAASKRVLWEPLFPGWHVVEAGDVAILSRYPLLASRDQVVTGGFDRKLLVARWQTPQGPLTTVAVHVTTALKPGNPAPNHSYNKPQRWKEVVRNARATAQTRAAQWPDIQNSVAGVSGPFVVAGDFNNPPRGQLYRRLTREWNDAFVQAGWGSGFTFPAKRALMRIDYLWVNSLVQVKRCFSPPTRVSDHRPVVADIAF